MNTTVTLAIVLVVLVVMNVWVHLGPQKAHPVTGPVAAVLLLALSRLAGLSWADLGLGRDSLVKGLVWGALLVALVAAGYLIAVAVPSARRFFRDVRYRVGPGSAFYLAFVAVPLGTVVFEEVAFRGVLWGLLYAEHGGGWATAVSAVLFGLWHVLPALDMSRTNTTLNERTSGRSAVLLAVLGTVAFTTLAGVVFGLLRWQTGSLLAPALLHWATNGLGVLASARVWAISPD